MDRKVCSVCREEKLLEFFPRNYNGLYKVSQKCKLCTAKESSEYRKKYPYKNAARKYSIPEEQVEAMWATENCMICNAPRKADKMLCIDHCHSTGRIRGVLCDDCNIALGKFKDNPESLKQAILYLEKYT